MNALSRYRDARIACTFGHLYAPTARRGVATRATADEVAAAVALAADEEAASPAARRSSVGSGRPPNPANVLAQIDGRPAADVRDEWTACDMRRLHRRG